MWHRILLWTVFDLPLSLGAYLEDQVSANSKSFEISYRLKYLTVHRAKFSLENLWPHFSRLRKGMESNSWASPFTISSSKAHFREELHVYATKPQKYVQPGHLPFGRHGQFGSNPPSSPVPRSQILWACPSPGLVMPYPPLSLITAVPGSPCSPVSSLVQ